MVVLETSSSSSGTPSYLAPEKAIEALSQYPQSDGLSLAELMERGPGKSGITYNDFLGKSYDGYSSHFKWRANFFLIYLGPISIAGPHRLSC
jgi:hypothetical protein